tara:strand:- start:329 stop:505 length:177 start_codon:yes stop_codon:yes gene_type:complete
LRVAALSRRKLRIFKDSITPSEHRQASHLLDFMHVGGYSSIVYKNMSSEFFACGLQGV